MNNVDDVLHILHSLYCTKTPTETFDDVKTRMYEDLLWYRRICSTLENLEIGDEQFHKDISFARSGDTMDKWFIWAKIDSNMAKLGLNGHNRKSKEDLRVGQANQDSSDHDHSTRSHGESGQDS
jgi:hypothetical protein